MRKIAPMVVVVAGLLIVAVAMVALLVGMAVRDAQVQRNDIGVAQPAVLSPGQASPMEPAPTSSPATSGNVASPLTDFFHRIKEEFDSDDHESSESHAGKEEKDDDD